MGGWLLYMAGELVRRVAAEFLQRHHQSIVIGAISGAEEALAQAQDLQPEVALVGLDMPGLETIPRLQKVLPGTGNSLPTGVTLRCNTEAQRSPPDQPECLVSIPGILHSDKHIIRGGAQ